MPDEAQPNPEPTATSEIGSFLLVAGGLAAALGAASCCALPLLLGSVGLGSAWLATVAWFAAPHRIALLIAAVLCILGGSCIFLWRRHVAACTPWAVCPRAGTTALLTILVLTGGVLTVLGYLYA